MKDTLLLLSLVCRTWTLSPASVTVSPDRSQYFEYEHISVSCEASDWTVWRYTTRSLQLSQCGSAWGRQTPPTCTMATVKVSSSGVYWCQDQRGHSSDAVNITITGGPVILWSPALPVMEGRDVTLRCQTQTTPPNLPADFYHNDILIDSQTPGHMTVRNFSKSDEGAYRCEVRGQGVSPSSWLLMRDVSQPVSLLVSPDSSQLTEYESLSLSCVAGGARGGWRVRRFVTSGGTLSTCGDKWGSPTDSGCVIHTAKQPDSAVYWCESPVQRQRSNSVNITVYGGPVILQSPALPVMEGRDVTLRCLTKTTPSDLPADFYKDGSLIRTEPTGHMTLHHVTRSDQGLYRCHIRGRGESGSSWISVTGSHGSAPASDPVGIMGTTLRFVVLSSPYLVSTVLMVSKYRQRSSGCVLSVSMAKPTSGEDDEGLDEQYDDVIADITTEHHF